MASLLEDYMIPQPVPGVNGMPDPRELEKAKYLAIMRMGMGMMQREPAGRAMSAGTSIYMDAEQNARRNALAQADLVMKQHTAMQQQREDMSKAQLLGSMTREQLRSMGLPEAVIDSIKYAKDPGARLEAYKSFYEKKVMSEGQSLIDPNTGNSSVVMPNKQGVAVPVRAGIPQFGMPVPGLQEANARATGLDQTAKNAADAQFAIEQVPTGVPGQTRPMTRQQLLDQVRGTTGVTNTALQQFKDAWAEEAVRTPVDDADAKRQQLTLATLQGNIEKLGGTTTGTQKPAGSGGMVVDPVAAQLRQKEAEGSLAAIATNHPMAQTAVQGIALQQEALKLLDSGKIKTGKASDLATEFGAWLQAGGFRESDDQVANTQAFMIMQARETLAILQSKALGSGNSITENDKLFAQKIAGGDQTVTEEALRKIIKMNEKYHRVFADNFNRDLQLHAKAYDSPTIISRYGIDVPPPYSPSSSAKATPAAPNVVMTEKGPAVFPNAAAANAFRKQHNLP